MSEKDETPSHGVAGPSTKRPNGTGDTQCTFRPLVICGNLSAFLPRPGAPKTDLTRVPDPYVSSHLQGNGILKSLSSIQCELSSCFRGGVQSPHIVGCPQISRRVNEQMAQASLLGF
jgi:hypothetical protein